MANVYQVLAPRAYDARDGGSYSTGETFESDGYGLSADIDAGLIAKIAPDSAEPEETEPKKVKGK